MRKIALVNQKGGCGKTTTAINLASCLAEMGKKALLVDLDPQGHAALALGVNTDDMEASIYEVLSGEEPISRAIFSVQENLDALFGDVVLSAFEQLMAGVRGREHKLSEQMAKIEQAYHYIIIDSPPSVGLLTFNGLMASDEVIIPVDSSYFSLQGLGKLLDTLRILEEKAKHRISIRILATNIDQRTAFSKKVVAALRKHFPDECLQTVIHTCTALREAVSRGKPICEYDPSSNAYRDYRNLTEEIVFGKPQIHALEKQDDRKGDKKEGTQEKRARVVTFKITAPPHAKVQIAGDFNGWQPQGLQFDSTHVEPFWLKQVELQPGAYQYKYLINGNWIPDPGNRLHVDDSLGGVNSLIEI